jgi:hypothetical protein
MDVGEHLSAYSPGQHVMSGRPEEHAVSSPHLGKALCGN